MSRLLALWKRLTDSLWFLPAVLTTAGFALALLLIPADDVILGDTPAREIDWLFAGGAEAAREILGAISGSIITVTGVVFSVTIVALQLASQQFTPRILRQFMSDRANQWVLGVFIGTFTYTLVVLRTVRAGDEGDAFVPSVAVTVAVLLVLMSIASLIFFIDHAARSIQADVILARVTRETLASFPLVAAVDERDVSSPDDIPAPAGEPSRVLAKGSGLIQSVDEERLVRLAAQHDLLLRVDRRVGAFVMPGVSLLSLWGETPSGEAVQALRAAFVLGEGRTPHQDPELGIIELVDIAVKALSPSINDPTTAMHAVERLGEVLRAIGTGRPAARARRDDAGAVRLILPPHDFEKLAAMAFDQVRHYGVANPSVAIKLMATLGEVAALVGTAEARVLERMIRHTAAHAEAKVTDPADLARVRAAAADALATAQRTTRENGPS